MTYTFHTYDTLDSTNRTAREWAHKGAPEGTVILADCQTQGRGRRGRSFFSPQGTGLYMSVILRPALSLAHLSLITTAAAVAVACAVETVTGETAFIKWVNDVYYRDKKVAGILAESAIDGTKTPFVVLGIGVNLTQPSGGFPPELQDKAGALFDTPCDVRERLCRLILENFESDYRRLEEKPFLDEYRRRSLLSGKTVTLLDVDDRPCSTAHVLGIDDEFALVIQTEQGVRRLTAGDVSLQL